MRLFIVFHNTFFSSPILSIFHLVIDSPLLFFVFDFIILFLLVLFDTEETGFRLRKLFQLLLTQIKFFNWLFLYLFVLLFYNYKFIKFILIIRLEKCLIYKTQIFNIDLIVGFSSIVSSKL